MGARGAISEKMAQAQITKHEQTEELCQSEARFRAIVDQAAAGVAETDLHGTFTFVNQKYCEITGYERDELLGMRQQDITYPDDLVRNNELLARMFAEHTSFQIEKRYVRKDGSPIWVSSSVGLISDAAGNPQSVLAVTRDFTDRKRAEMNAAFLADVEKDFAHLRDIDDVLEAVGTKINRYFGFSTLTFADINHAADEAVIIYNSRDPDVHESAGRYCLADFLANAIANGSKRDTSSRSRMLSPTTSLQTARHTARLGCAR